MVPERRTASSVRSNDTVWERIADWVLIGGDRRVVAGALTTVIIGILGTFISAGLVAVGPNSSTATVFGSGLVGGVVTLLTIALSINQLVLSRVFGSINTLTDRLTGSRDLRQTVEDLARVPSSPNDPAAFLSLIATTLSDRVSGLLKMNNATDWDPPAEVTSTLRDIAAYGDSIDANLEANKSVTGVLGIILGPEYAVNMTAVHNLQNEYAASIPEAAQAELQAIEDLLESLAIIRQFYKTIALQQDFATLSRQLVYSGIIALLSAMLVTLIYQPDSVTVPEPALPFIVSLGIGIVVTPLALFVAYILRAATVARQTVSVGPFVPPRDK